MLEVKMEDCLNRDDPAGLVSVLQHEGLTSSTLNRLNQLVTRDLREPGFSRVLTVMKTLDLLSEDRAHLQTLVSQGLTAKVLLWSEALHHVIVCDRDAENLLSLTDAFLDFFMLLAQSSLPVSQLSVVLLHLAQLALEPDLPFSMRLEAIRTFNSIMEGLTREQRRLIQNNHNMADVMCQMAAALQTVGDYELQVSLSEALCRLTPRKQRDHRARRWFSSGDISAAFCDITDKDFEVDCRRFLNFVNSFHGDRRRVYTFPCLAAFLGSTQLFPPKDDKLEKFWIDFNLSSECVSFFVDDPQGFLWGSIHLLREAVDHYSFQLKHDGCIGLEAILRVHLNKPITHHNCSGQTVALTFDSEHHEQLQEAARRVYKEVRCFTDVEQTDGTVRVPNVSCRVYSRKKPKKESHLKILPLSSPSSGDEDNSVVKNVNRSRAELQFDQLRTSTPTYESGADRKGSPTEVAWCPVGEGLNVSPEKTQMFGGRSTAVRKEIFASSRKRAAADSGYLSDTPAAEPAHKSAGHQLQEEEEEEEEEDESKVPALASEAELKADLSRGVMTAFKTFKMQLEEHFTGCWRDVEAEVLRSLKDCQQQVSALLAAVHQQRYRPLTPVHQQRYRPLTPVHQQRHRPLTPVHQQRLSLLQTFENNITFQLKHLQEASASLSSIDAEILSSFRSETQRLGLFCEDQQQRLKSPVSKDLTSPRPPKQ
ncbi:synaptonemal complex protein 2-like [Takifugu flavidus]|uniref:synaptonemal complex protein 2-like n=1 Tax=Takifugu flavidus TaxID=433684 RepID=UPI0025447A52|nr:synaptonemal complex protein 2-like [Takifugu flavidus]